MLAKTQGGGRWLSWGRGRRRAPALGFPPLPRPTAAGPGLPPTRNLPIKALQCHSLTSTPFLCTHRGGDGRKDAGGAHHWRGGAKKKSYLLRPKKNASQGVAGARRRMLKKGWVGWVGESLEAVAGRAVWRGRGGGGGRRSGGAAVGGGERLDGGESDADPLGEGSPPSHSALSLFPRVSHITPYRPPQQPWPPTCPTSRSPNSRSVILSESPPHCARPTPQDAPSVFSLSLPVRAPPCPRARCPPPASPFSTLASRTGAPAVAHRARARHPGTRQGRSLQRKHTHTLTPPDLFFLIRRRRLPSLTRMATAPSPPRSWARSCGPWARTRRRRSCR